MTPPVKSPLHRVFSFFAAFLAVGAVSLHFLTTAVPVHAAQSCDDITISPNFDLDHNWPGEYTTGRAPQDIFIQAYGLDPSARWGIRVVHNEAGNDDNHRHFDLSVNPDGTARFEYADHVGMFDNPDGDDSDMILELYRNDNNNWQDPGSVVCEIRRYQILSEESSAHFSILVEAQDSQGNWGSGCIQKGRPTRYTIEQWIVESDGTRSPRNSNEFKFRYDKDSGESGDNSGVYSMEGFANGIITFSSSSNWDENERNGGLSALYGRYTIKVFRPSGLGSDEFERGTVEVFPSCPDDEVTASPSPSPDSGLPSDYNFCEQLPSGPARGACVDCYDGRNGPNGIYTAVGCIPYGDSGRGIISSLVLIGLNLSGGVAVLMIMVAGFKFSTSQGDPKKVSEAKEMMTSAVVGLLFVIFSVTILQFIGINILRIPGFGGN